MIPVLVTTKQASDHLRLDIVFEGSPPDDELLDELQLKIDAATEIVLDYIKVDVAGSPGVIWTAETVPGPIRAAILLVLNALWDDRNGTGDGDYLKPGGAVTNLLRRYRLPTLA